MANIQSIIRRVGKMHNQFKIIILIAVTMSVFSITDAYAFSGGAHSTVNQAQYDSGSIQGKVDGVMGKNYADLSKSHPDFAEGYDKGYTKGVAMKDWSDKREMEMEIVHKYEDIIKKNYEELIDSLYIGIGIGSQGGGDPLIFSLKDGISACTVRMHPDQAASSQWYFDLYGDGVIMPMERQLCESSIMAFHDKNRNGIMDNGKEMMWHTELNAYDFMKLTDLYEEGNIPDGQLNENDASWDEIKFMTHDFEVLTAFQIEQIYGKRIIGLDYQNHELLKTDAYGIGTYSDCRWEGVLNHHDCKVVSDEHFRIFGHNPTGVMLEDGTTEPTFAAMQTGLNDCTIFDMRYMNAEYALSMRTSETSDTALQLYKDGLEYCQTYEFTSEDPDRYLSHWVSGIAASLHTEGNWNEAKNHYETALEMSPDNPHYRTDYALLLYQLKVNDSNSTLELIQDVLKDHPKHRYANIIEAHLKYGVPLK